MERTQVTEKELLSFLNKELQKAGQHEDSFFESVIRMKIDDRTGCNWASAVVKSSEGMEVCPPDAERIVNEAKAKFNLK